MISIEKRKEILEDLGYTYDYKGIMSFQKDYMYRRDWDGEWGTNTENTALTVYNVKHETKNFKPSEFRCECGGRYCCGYPDYMKPEELKHIQRIRDHYGKPITVTCGLRCKAYNAMLNGSVANSGHLRGFAIDFYQPGVTDTLPARKKSIEWIRKQPNHEFSYGKDMKGTDGIYRSAAYMGNAMHTETHAATEAKQADGKLTVDGVAGKATIKVLQKFLDVTVDGVISGQTETLNKYYTGIKSVSYGKGGSATVRAIQRWCGITQDGIWGKETSKALQKKLGVTADGVFGAGSVKALQKYLNANEKAVYPKSDIVIDVSEFQSAIDWAKVKKAGVVGVIVRCGYRGAEKGTLQEDAMYLTHIQGAAKVGLKVGIYFFTQAINAAEGKAEAAYTLNQMKRAGVKISYPIAIDSENVFYKKNGKTYPGRANGISKAKRTEAIKAFCDEIITQGYDAMIYASTSWLYDKLDMSKLPYKVWCAQYNDKCEYTGKHVIWQYTSDGKIDGIKGNVDMNHCYITEIKKETVIYTLPSEKQIKEASNAGIHKRILLQMEKIAADNSYTYVKYSDTDKLTHQCPICHASTHKDKAHKGGNCIWGAFQSWHHGGKIGSKCSCQVLTDPLYNKMLKATDSEAYKIAAEKIGVNDIEVIRNNGKAIPTSWIKAADICVLFNGSSYYHTILSEGGDKYGDCTSGRTDHIKVHNVMSEKTKNNVKMLIRYTGGFTYLQKYDEGEAVKLIQKWLNGHGYSCGNADGIFGDNTEKAVISLQTKLNLDADGIVGPATLKAMQEAKK